MIIHSIVSNYDIFLNSGEGQTFSAVGTEPVCGGFIEISEYGGKRQVTRLFSTNPALYLDKRYQPFTDIN